MRVLMVVYDDEAAIHVFPAGLAYIAATLKKEKIDVEIYNQDLHHYPEEHLTDYINNNKFDIIALGIVGGYHQYKKLLKISQAINQSKNRPFYVIGGHGPSPEPEYFLKISQADAVVIGEGEVTIINLLNALSNHSSLAKVKGIAYREGDKVTINERQPLIEDIDSIPMPAYELFPLYYYRLLPIPKMDRAGFAMRMLSGRGCTFKCNFCYRMDKGFRPRSKESIVEEIMHLKEKYLISYIGFNDELLMSSVSRVEELCTYMIKSKVDVKWCCNGRLNYAKPDLLKLMKKSGCVAINYGIEAMDDQVLKNMDKALNTKQIISGVEATQKSGIGAVFNILFGNYGDTEKTLEKGVEFILKYYDGIGFPTIKPVTPYPGSPLYYDSIKKGLLKGCKDFYENKHKNSDLLTVNFTNLNDEDFHRCLFEANKRLVNSMFKFKAKSFIAQSETLYLKGDATFRGFRHT